MVRTITLVLAGLILCASGQAQIVRRLVPVFAQDVNGANGSLWRSELRLYNDSDNPQIVTFDRIMPFPGTTCSLPEPAIVQPRHLLQIRSVACPNGSAAAFELSADAAVQIQAIVINVAASSDQDEGCCNTGFAETVPVIDVGDAYSSRRVVANLAIPRASGTGRPLIRHNIGIVNPGDQPLAMRFEELMPRASSCSS